MFLEDRKTNFRSFISISYFSHRANLVKITAVDVEMIGLIEIVKTITKTQLKKQTQDKPAFGCALGSPGGLIGLNRRAMQHNKVIMIQEAQRVRLNTECRKLCHLRIMMF